MRFFVSITCHSSSACPFFTADPQNAIGFEVLDSMKFVIKLRQNSTIWTHFRFIRFNWYNAFCPDSGTTTVRSVPRKLKVFRGHRDLVLKKSVERKTIMSYITVQEAAKKWGISERLVRRYCAEGRIQDLAQYDGIWQIPEDAVKPSRIKKDTITTPQIPPLLKNLIKQRDGRQYRGLYDYVQINMVYSNGRMASNRLTRNQIELLYKTDRIVTGSEAIKINDIIEARNHFLAVDMVLSNVMKPLNQTLIHQIQMQLLSDNCRHKRHAPIPYGYRKSSTAV